MAAIWLRGCNKLPRFRFDYGLNRRLNRLIHQADDSLVRKLRFIEWHLTVVINDLRLPLFASLVVYLVMGL